MTDAQALTKGLQRLELAVDDLVPNPDNPNEMTDREFNLLYDNISKVGLTDPILVRPHPEQEGKYEIVGGEHRWQAAKIIGFETVPCTVVELDGDNARFQLMRHNMIRGKLSPAKFLRLYESLQKKYESEIAAEMMGFASEEEFRKLVDATAKSLPVEMQQEFKEASKEIKTVEGLAKLLNQLFSKHGDTLPYGYMVFDYGDKMNVWLRMKAMQYEHFRTFAKACREQRRSVDHVMTAVLQLIAQGEFDLSKAIATCPEMVIPEGMPVPTLDLIQEDQSLDAAL